MFNLSLKLEPGRLPAGRIETGNPPEVFESGQVRFSPGHFIEDPAISQASGNGTGIAVSGM
jgi:hypothetical protein